MSKYRNVLTLNNLVVIAQSVEQEMDTRYELYLMCSANQKLLLGEPIINVTELIRANLFIKLKETCHIW